MDPTLNISKMDSTKMNAAAKLWHNMNKEKLNLGDWTGSNEDIEMYKKAHLIQEGEAGYVEGEENYRDDISMESLIYQQLIKSSNKYGTVDSAKERNDLIVTMEGINMLDSKKDYLAVNANRTEEDYNTYVNEEIVKLQDHFLKDFYKQTVLTNSPMYFMGNNGRAIETGAVEHTALSPKVATTSGDGSQITWGGFTGSSAYIKKRQNAAEAMRIIGLAWESGDFNSIAGNLNIVPLGNGRFQAQTKNGDNVGMPFDTKNPNHLQRVYELSNKGLQTDAEISAGVDFEPSFTDKTPFQEHVGQLTLDSFTGTEDQVHKKLTQHFSEYPDVIKTLGHSDMWSNYEIKITVDGEKVTLNTKNPTQKEVDGFIASLKSLVDEHGAKLPDVKK
jgi:hypothetical protein